uniref:Dolichyl-diphosphooligosaccharide--protein glycosyltransferase subunit STT3B-like n=1 Tax=Stegastes partitus TaxID=144197 RepID=A0A3B4ZUK2_9TELE
MAEHHAASDGKHKASTNAGGSVHGNSRPGAAGGGGGGGGKGGLSGGLTQPAGWQSLLSFSILFLACLAGFSSRLFAVIRFESIIHEFDPWSRRAALWASAPACRGEKKGGVRGTAVGWMDGRRRRGREEINACQAFKLREVLVAKPKRFHCSKNCFISLFSVCTYMYNICAFTASRREDGADLLFRRPG